MGVQYLNGTTFNLRKTRAQDDRSIYWMLNSKIDIVSRGCALTYDSSSIYIGSGEFLCRGGNINVTATSSVDIPTVTGNTYYSLVFEIDLSQTNTASQFNQGQFKMVSGGSQYPTLTQSDLDGSGTIYQMLFADIIVSTAGISSFSDMRPTVSRTVEFSATGWTLTNGIYTQSVRASVCADSHPKWYGAYEGLTAAQLTNAKIGASQLDYIVCTNSVVTGYCEVQPSYTFSIKLEG